MNGTPSPLAFWLYSFDRESPARASEVGSQLDPWLKDHIVAEVGAEQLLPQRTLDPPKLRVTALEIIFADELAPEASATCEHRWADRLEAVQPSPDLSALVHDRGLGDLPVSLGELTKTSAV
jgi:hypothetical protein